MGWRVTALQTCATILAGAGLKGVKVILLDLTALLLRFYRKLNRRMGQLCPVSDKKAKKGYSRMLIIESCTG